MHLSHGLMPQKSGIEPRLRRVALLCYQRASNHFSSNCNKGGFPLKKWQFMSKVRLKETELRSNPEALVFATCIDTPEKKAWRFSHKAFPFWERMRSRSTKDHRPCGSDRRSRQAPDVLEADCLRTHTSPVCKTADISMCGPLKTPRDLSA
jgi:hypothetical protein